MANKPKVSIRAKMSRAGKIKALKKIKANNKFELKQQRLVQKQERLSANNQLRDLKNQNRLLKEQSRRTGNAVQRRIQEGIDLRRAKADAKIAKYNAEATNKKLDPELRKLEKQTESQVKIERAKTAGKVGAYTALAQGASKLGKGLIDEGNRDRDAEFKSLSDNLDKIFNGGSNESDPNSTGTELETGVE